MTGSNLAGANEYAILVLASEVFLALQITQTGDESEYSCRTERLARNYLDRSVMFSNGRVKLNADPCAERKPGLADKSNDTLAQDN